MLYIFFSLYLHIYFKLTDIDETCSLYANVALTSTCKQAERERERERGREREDKVIRIGLVDEIVSHILR